MVKIKMELLKKFTDKNQLAYWAIVVLSLMLLEATVSNFISSKITFLPVIVLSFISLLIIFIITDTILKMVLEV